MIFLGNTQPFEIFIEIVKREVTYFLLGKQGQSGQYRVPNNKDVMVAVVGWRGVVGAMVGC